MFRKEWEQCRFTFGAMSRDSNKRAKSNRVATETHLRLVSEVLSSLHTSIRNAFPCT
jgi:hypothetical protein